MYGNLNGLRDEQTALAPTSPYGVSKTAAHRLCGVYRERGIFAVGGILFNHESPRRGPEMVTRKITLAAADWAQGKKNKLKLGNMQARRDWGYAGDYIRAMHAMLQQEKPNDYVIATGESHSVYEFVVEVLHCLDLVPSGRNVAEVVNEYVEVDPKLFRTGEIHDLRGDSSLARRSLNWNPEVDFKGLVRMMVESDALGREEDSLSQKRSSLAAEKWLRFVSMSDKPAEQSPCPTYSKLCIKCPKLWSQKQEIARRGICSVHYSAGHGNAPQRYCCCCR